MSTKTFNAFETFMDETSQIMQLLSDKNRLGIFSILFYGESTVTDIFKCLNLKQNLISHHLKMLKKGELVMSRRRGREIYYSIDPDGLKKIRITLKKFST